MSFHGNVPLDKMSFGKIAFNSAKCPASKKSTEVDPWEFFFPRYDVRSTFLHLDVGEKNFMPLDTVPALYN